MATTWPPASMPERSASDHVALRLRGRLDEGVDAALAVEEGLRLEAEHQDHGRLALDARATLWTWRDRRGFHRLAGIRCDGAALAGTGCLRLGRTGHTPTLEARKPCPFATARFPGSM